jgi:hypothetical protein
MLASADELLFLSFTVRMVLAMPAAADELPPERTGNSVPGPARPAVSTM